jgi:hypothetical protein
MRVLGAILFTVLLMTRSTWSGGVTWSGTGKWMPDGATPGRFPNIEVAIAGTLMTGLQSASWRLGPTDFLSDLSPDTASLSFTGYFECAPGDTIVITSDVGALWVGRVDTCSTTWGSDSIPWTTVTGMDPIGALGEARLEDYPIDAWLSVGPTTGFPEYNLEAIMETLATHAAVDLDVVDDSVSGLPILDWIGDTTYTGDILSLLNAGAKQSNAMLALGRDGGIHAVIREAVTPAGQVDVTDRYREWTSDISIAVDINRWVTFSEQGRDQADIDQYGDRSYDATGDFLSEDNSGFDDWIAFGGRVGPVFTVVFALKSWDDDDLMLLDPFDWIAEDFYGDIQVMSVSHSVSVSPPEWTVTITADNLLALL